MGQSSSVADRVIKLMLKKGIQVLDSHIIIFGFTFKENCPDVRNTKVVDIVKALKEYNLNITIFDPWANPVAVKHEYGLEVVNEFPKDEKFDAAIVAVAHHEFEAIDVKSVLKQPHIIFDVKATRSHNEVDSRL